MNSINEKEINNIMSQKEIKRTITPEMIRHFTIHLHEQEKSTSTIALYQRSLAALCKFLGDEPITKSTLIEWKESLIRRYAATSVNTMLAGINARQHGVDTCCCISPYQAFFPFDQSTFCDRLIAEKFA